MSATVDLQDFILNTLLNDATVAGYVSDRVYDKRPSPMVYPCITFGPSDAIPADADCIDAETETFQIDIWHRDQGRKWLCKDTTAAVRAALHEADSDFATIRVVARRVFDDPDGITVHGIVTVEAIIEEGGS